MYILYVVGHTSVIWNLLVSWSHSSWGLPTTTRTQDQRSESTVLYFDFLLLIVPSLFTLMFSAAGVDWRRAVRWTVGIEYSHIKVFCLLLSQKFWTLMSSLALSSVLVILQLNTSPFRGWCVGLMPTFGQTLVRSSVWCPRWICAKWKAWVLLDS